MCLVNLCYKWISSTYQYQRIIFRNTDTHTHITISRGPSPRFQLVTFGYFPFKSVYKTRPLSSRPIISFGLRPRTIKDPAGPLYSSVNTAHRFNISHLLICNSYKRWWQGDSPQCLSGRDDKMGTRKWTEIIICLRSRKLFRKLNTFLNFS